MLEPGLKNVSLATGAVTSKDTILTAPPAEAPLLAPLGKDMHITILILPGLQYYASKIAHGVKSRAWGADHDGLSFRLEKIAFVDDGATAGEERSAATRKERIGASGGTSTEKMPPVRLRTGELKRPLMKTAMRPVTEVAALA